MQSPLVSIHLIVKDGEKYIRQCLEHVQKQTYPNIEFRVFDNASTDRTREIVKEIMPSAEIIRFPKNYILGGGFNRSLSWSRAPYVVGLCVDVMMAPDFIERAVAVAEAHPTAGVVQAKVLRYDYEHAKVTSIIDTTGMQIFRSRRIINRGHGEEDTGQYNKAEEIFCYEGAVPFFRREALEAIKMPKSKPDAEFPYEYLDEDFVWYADELDLGWRLHHAGWMNWYDPTVLAAHDRQTTKKLSKGYRGFIELRKTIPAFKRVLDWRNQRLAFLKNDYLSSVLKDVFFWLPREMMMFGYFIIFERTSLWAYIGMLRMAPLMLRKRRAILKNDKTNAGDIRKWFL
ncbi:MAG: glycosyltransferase [Candidatus Spechtbacteria bacterium]|nr:glycosyltransferase [Candidatus Spechtbacteria bacterium]